MANLQDERERKQIMAPCCDIYETGSGISVRMEMPGVPKEGLEIKVDGDLLVVSGKKAKGTEKGEYLVKEIHEGDYYHEFTIDDTIDRNKIDASLEKGILNLTLGIKESEKPRKINVVAK